MSTKLKLILNSILTIQPDIRPIQYPVQPYLEDGNSEHVAQAGSKKDFSEKKYPICECS